MANEENKGHWFWPRITGLPSAIGASDQGFWAAIVVASITAIFATIALLAQVEIATINASAYVDAVLFGVTAWRIKRRSKFFAVFGLCLFIIEKAYQFSQPQAAASGAIMAVVLLILFINGVRGTFAYHRFSRPGESAPMARNL